MHGQQAGLGKSGSKLPHSRAFPRRNNGDFNPSEKKPVVLKRRAETTYSFHVPPVKLDYNGSG